MIDRKLSVQMWKEGARRLLKRRKYPDEWRLLATVEEGSTLPTYSPMGGLRYASDERVVLGPDGDVDFLANNVFKLEAACESWLYDKSEEHREILFFEIVHYFGTYKAHLVQVGKTSTTNRNNAKRRRGDRLTHAIDDIVEEHSAEIDENSLWHELKRRAEDDAELRKLIDPKPVLKNRLYGAKQRFREK